MEQGPFFSPHSVLSENSDMSSLNVLWNSPMKPIRPEDSISSTSEL